MSLPRISLCVITGNEDHAVDSFLNSFSGAFDELCMVRAIGNQPHDKTLSLAKAWCAANGKAFLAGEYFNAHSAQRNGKAPDYTAPINDNDPATWHHVDDFAAARNIAWKMATCPWQFWADMDDLLAVPEAGQPGGAELIRLCAAANSHDFFLFTYDLRHQAESNVRERLFRTGIAEWNQPIHETCRTGPKPEGKDWRVLVEPRVVFSHAPAAEKKRDIMRNRRIMSWHCRYIHAFAFEIHREWFYEWQVTRDPDHAERATRWAEIAYQTDCILEQRFDILLNQAEIAAEQKKDFELALDLCWSAMRIDPRSRTVWGSLAKYELELGRGPRAAMATGFMQAVPKPPPSGYPKSDKYHGWEGAHIRARSLRAAGKQEQAEKFERGLFAQNGKRISLLHATRGRPQQALQCRSWWFKTAFVPLGVEHIFAIDADDAESLAALKDYRHVVVNEPRGCVKAWNAAAAACEGNVLMQLSDDWIPSHDWDVRVWDALEKEASKRIATSGPATDPANHPELVGSTPLVLAVRDGHRTDSLLCMAILTRARYQQQYDSAWHEGSLSITTATLPGTYKTVGPYLFHPDYFGVYSDNEYSVRAFDDGVVVDGSHIQFDHRHPIWAGKPVEQWDATHQRQNTPERYAEGKAVFNRRNPKHAVP